MDPLHPNQNLMGAKKGRSHQRRHIAYMIKPLNKNRRDIRLCDTSERNITENSRRNMFIGVIAKWLINDLG